MDIASLNSQQVYTLYGVAAFLTFATLALGAAAIGGALCRLSAGRQPPSVPDRPTFTAISRGPGPAAAAGEPQPTPGPDVAV